MFNQNNLTVNCNTYGPSYLELPLKGCGYLECNGWVMVMDISGIDIDLGWNCIYCTQDSNIDTLSTLPAAVLIGSQRKLLSVVVPPIAQVSLSPGEWSGVLVVASVWGGAEVGGEAGGVVATVTGGVEGEGRGTVDQLLQHLLARHRQSSSLGNGSSEVSRVGLDGLRVGAPEDGRQNTGSQRR